MPRRFLYCFLFFASFLLKGQTSLFVGSDNLNKIFIEAHATLYVSGNLTAGDGVPGDSIDGQIVLSGDLIIGGNIINLDASSQVLTFQADTSTFGPRVILNGTGNQFISGNRVFMPYMVINKPSGEVILSTTVSLFSGIQMLSGSLNLTNQEIRLYHSLYSAPLISGENETRRIYGNGGSIWLESETYNGYLTHEPAGLGLSFYVNDGDGVITSLRRVHDNRDDVADNSVNRYYLLPVANTSVVSNVTIEYFDQELEGVPEGELAVYHTSDNGITWIPHNSGIHAGPQRVVTPDQISFNDKTVLALARRYCIPNAPVFDIDLSIESENSPHTGGIFTDVNNSQNICEISNVYFASTSDIDTLYRWTRNTTEFLTNETSFDSLDISSAGSGLYSLFARTTRGCELTKNLQVNVRSNPSSSFEISPNNSDGRICRDHVITFHGVGSLAEDGSVIASYYWEYTDGTTDSILGDPLAKHIFPQEDLYFPNLTVTTEYLCESFDQDEDTDTLSILDPPEILDLVFRNDLTEVIDEECEREIVTFETSTLYRDTTPLRPPLLPGGPTHNDTELNWTLVYTWDFDDDSVLVDSAFTGFSDVDHAFTYRYDNRHNIVMQVEDRGPSFSCQSVDSAYLYVHPLPFTSFNVLFNEDLSEVPGEICEGVYIYFENTSWIRQAQYRPSQISGYWWDFGDGNTSTDENPVFQYVHEGVYEVNLVAYSTEGCISDTASYTITVHPAPDGVLGNDIYTLSDSLCVAEDMVLVNGTTIPYGTVSYVWDLGDGSISTDQNPIHPYSDAGNYKVSLLRTSNHGCTNELNHLDIIVNDFPVPDFEFQDACEGSEVQFFNTSFLPGDIDEITYSWNVESSFISAEKNPLHEFEVEDFQGSEDSAFNISLEVTSYSSTTACSEMVEYDITIVRNPYFDFGSVILAENDTLLNPSETPNAYVPTGSSFLWDDGYDESTSESLTVSETGIFQVNVTSPFGCETIKQIPVYRLESVDLGNDRTICVSEILEAAPSPASLLRPVNYRWFKDEQQIQNGPISSIIVEENGNYEVEVTYEALDQQRVLSDEVQIEVVQLSAEEPSCISKYYPTVDLGEDIYSCQSSVILDAGNPGMNYLWSNYSTGRTLEVTRDGKYGVAVMSSIGNISYDTIEVKFLDQFLPGLGVEIDTCGAFELAPQNEAVLYLWSTGETTPSITVGTSGLVGLEVITANQCFREEVVAVTVNQIPDVDLGEDIRVCEGEEVNLTSSISGRHIWSNGKFGPELPVKKSGTYKLAVVSDEQCIGIDSIKVEFKALPYIGLADSLKGCDSLFLQAGNEGKDYLWSTGDTSEHIIIRETGLYKVEVASENGCVNHDTTFVMIGDSPQLDLGEDLQLCPGESVSIDVGFNNWIHKVLWNTLSTLPAIQISGGGDYIATVTDDFGCSASDSISVIQHSEIPVVLPDTILLCDSSGTSIEIVLDDFETIWTLGEEVVSESESLTVSTPGIYRLHVEDEFGCSTTDSLVALETNQDLFASFLIPSTVSQGDIVSFIALTEPTAPEYYWSFGDGAESFISNPKYQYFIPGEYVVTLTVSNGTCSHSLSKSILVESSEGGRLIGAEANVYQFTEILKTSIFPNPANDRLTLDIELSNEGSVQVNIYNLEGLEVFNHLYSSHLDASLYFDLVGLKEGVYVIFIQVGKQYRTERFVKIE